MHLYDFSIDKVKEWSNRHKKRKANKKITELPFGFSDQSTDVSTHLINSL